MSTTGGSQQESTVAEGGGGGDHFALLLHLSLRAETKTNRRQLALITLVGSMICKPFCLVQFDTTPLSHPTDYPSDWIKQHALFGQYMCGIEKTCGIDQSGGQYRTREYYFSLGPHATTAGSAGCLL